MHLLLLCIGKPRSFAESIADYESRAQRYWPLRVRELREESGRGIAPDVVREREGRRLLEAAGSTAHLVACDERGEDMSSTAFAAWLQRERERATRDVAFMIGGAHGLAPLVLERAETRLAVAPWTLPHELARLVLVEQLYRAGTLVRGEPYHK